MSSNELEWPAKAAGKEEERDVTHYGFPFLFFLLAGLGSSAKAITLAHDDAWFGPDFQGSLCAPPLTDV